jgi:redox-sensing transcriptional repressor
MGGETKKRSRDGVATGRKRRRAGMIGADDRHGRIPNPVVRRLVHYTRVLKTLESAGIEKVSSRQLADNLGINSAQVRKDLACFGQFGVPGVGYRVGELRASLKRILGTDKEVRVALVGVGNLGSALMSYGGFVRQGFRIVVAFDIDGRKIGTVRSGVPVHAMSEIGPLVREHGIAMAILCVPAEAAQSVADALVEAGITGILNFVPVRLTVPPPVKVQPVDLTVEIETLSYYLR